MGVVWTSKSLISAYFYVFTPPGSFFLCQPYLIHHHSLFLAPAPYSQSLLVTTRPRQRPLRAAQPTQEASSALFSHGHLNYFQLCIAHISYPSFPHINMPFRDTFYQACYQNPATRSDEVSFKHVSVTAFNRFLLAFSYHFMLVFLISFPYVAHQPQQKSQMAPATIGSLPTSGNTSFFHLPFLILFLA